MNAKFCISLFLVSVLLLSLLEDASAEERQVRSARHAVPALRAKEGEKLNGQRTMRVKRALGDKSLRNRWASLLKAKEFWRNRFVQAMRNKKPVETVAAKKVTV